MAAVVAGALRRTAVSDPAGLDVAVEFAMMRAGTLGRKMAARQHPCAPPPRRHGACGKSAPPSASWSDTFRVQSPPPGPRHGATLRRRRAPSLLAVGAGNAARRRSQTACVKCKSASAWRHGCQPPPPRPRIFERRRTRDAGPSAPENKTHATSCHLPNDRTGMLVQPPTATTTRSTSAQRARRAAATAAFRAAARPGSHHRIGFYGSERRVVSRPTRVCVHCLGSKSRASSHLACRLSRSAARPARRRIAPPRTLRCYFPQRYPHRRCRRSQ